MDLVALKTRLLKNEVPIRRDESECVTTAASRSCFALALLFQKSAPAKSESRKKRNIFFVSHFSIICSLYQSKRQNDIFDQRKRPVDKKGKK